MAEIIVVTSGKGGVGKTTTSASLAMGLARMGKRVAVIDFDVGLRNLDLIIHRNKALTGGVSALLEAADITLPPAS